MSRQCEHRCSSGLPHNVDSICLVIHVSIENPPITDIVDSGIIPLFVQFLTRDDQCTLQVTSSCILSTLMLLHYYCIV